MNAQNHNHIGLALGSGGARGLAHIGVLRALTRHAIPVHCIAGSSIGAMVGGFYAAGCEIDDLERIASGTDWRTLFSLVDPHIGSSGLIGGDKVRALIEGSVRAIQIEDARIPFAAVATDLHSGEPVVFTSGDMTTAIRASISVPLVFKPVPWHSTVLADGGLSEPVPVSVTRSLGADIVIAVNLDAHTPNADKPSPTLYDVANDALGILRYHLARANCATADIAIDINLGRNYWYEFTNAREKIDAGDAATEAIIPKLKELIA